MSEEELPCDDCPRGENCSIACKPSAWEYKTTRLFILAGGEGSRFFPFTSLIPKCLISVAGKPCVRRIVEDAWSQDFKDIVLCINEEATPHFKHEFRDLDIKFSVTPTPMGTAGELLEALAYVSDTFILRYGDDLTKINYRKLVAFHESCGSDVTLAVTKQLVLPVGVVEVEAEATLKAKAFIEKPTLEKFAWTGVAVFNREMLEYFHYGEDIGANIIPRILNEKHDVFIYDTRAEWYDTGNIEHWRRADKYFRGNAK